MQLEVEDQSPIRKRVQVTVPSSRVDSSFSAAYNEISRRVSLPGFRRGRIPMSHLQKRYGKQAAADVSQVLIQEGWRKALDELSIVPVGEPQIDAQLPQPGKEYGFSITVEVTPHIELQPFDNLSVEMDQWSVSDEVVDHEIEHLAEEVAQWEPITEARPAAKGDLAVIDYQGSLGDEPFPGGTAEDAEIQLGSGQLIPGFEDQIIGHAVGEAFDVNVTFPAGYHATHLAGRDARFAVTLKDLKARKVLPPGPELAALLNEEDMDAVRAGMRERIEKRHASRAKDEAKQRLREQLAGAYDFDLPPSMVAAGLADKRSELMNEAVQGGATFEDARAGLEDRLAAAEDEVRAEVRAGLVLDAIAEAEQVEVSEQEVNAYIDLMVRSMGQYGVRLRQAYRDPNRRAGLRRRMRQDKVLDFLLTRANVTAVAREVPLHVHDDEGNAEQEGNAE